MKINKYDKNSNFSYTLGSFPTIELLANKPENVQIVYFHSILSDELSKQIAKYCKEYKIPMEVNDKLINRLSPKQNCYVIGIFEKFKTELEESANHIVLVNPSNNGNLGTILRSMLGFALENLAVISPAVDIFNPEVMRASMGALFSIRFQYFQDIQTYLDHFPQRHLYTFTKEGKQKLENSTFEKPASLVFGNESTGLSDKTTKLGQSVCISQTHQIDSLNLSISCAIAMHSFYSQIV